MFVFQSHQAAALLDVQLQTLNATKHVVFDQENQSIVLSGNGVEIALSPTDILEKNAVDVIYVANRPNDALPYTAFKMGTRATCDEIAQKEVELSFTGIRMKEKMKDGCVYSMPETPKNEPLTIRLSTESVETFVLPYARYSLTIESSSTSPVNVSVADAMILKWFPSPILGCGLIDAYSSWDCVTEFLRDSITVPGVGRYGTALNEMLPRLLSLKPRSHNIESASDAHESLPATDELLEKMSKQESEALDNFLSQVEAAPSNPPVGYSWSSAMHASSTLVTIEERKDRIADAIISILKSRPTKKCDATTTCISGGKPLDIESSSYIKYVNRWPALTTVEWLENILSGLPKSEFHEPGRKVLTLLNKMDEVAPKMVSLRFAEKLSDFGPETVPLFTRLAVGEGYEPYYVGFIGLCRSGKYAESAVPIIDDLLRNYRQRNIEEYTFETALLALARIGHPELVEAHPYPYSSSSIDKSNRDERISSMGPTSPVELCEPK